MFWGFDPRCPSPNLVVEVSMQRLFSMFPNGWPGRGLLLLRLVFGIFLIHDGLTELLGAPQWDGIFRQSLSTGAGILLLVGLWTPIAGVLVVVVELWAVVSQADSLRSCIVLAALGAALAMLGPGVRSIDARLFGRKRIDIRER
jgi:putative oxidoreductase